MEKFLLRVSSAQESSMVTKAILKSIWLASLILWALFLVIQSYAFENFQHHWKIVCIPGASISSQDPFMAWNTWCLHSTPRSFVQKLTILSASWSACEHWDPYAKRFHEKHLAVIAKKSKWMLPPWHRQWVPCLPRKSFLPFLFQIDGNIEANK